MTRHRWEEVRCDVCGGATKLDTMKDDPEATITVRVPRTADERLAWEPGVQVDVDVCKVCRMGSRQGAGEGLRRVFEVAEKRFRGQIK